jgi:4-amino-4-deoxy-L-arabinose transferase-like glycosyltransferase
LAAGVTGSPASDGEDYGGRDFAFFWAAVLLLLPSIWSPCSITGQDEYWLSFRTVLEMQERGEWLTPYVNGEVRLQKPPLLYWLMRVSYLTFGSNLFAARIWTVLFGAGMALFTAKLARRYRGDGAGTGYLAGVFVLGAAGVMIDARRAMFDLPVGCLCTAAIYYSVIWYGSGRLRHALGAALALAAASMTKGPVALWFFAAALLAAACVRRGRPGGPLWHWLVATAAFGALALPWPLWVQAAHPEFWQVMQTQAEHREFGLPEPKRIPALLGAVRCLVVPWSLAVVGGAWATLRGRLRRGSPARWLLCWIVIGLLPFAFMKAFERYMLALVCPMSILAALWLSTCSDRLLRLHTTVATCLVGIPVLVFSLFAAWFQLAYLFPLAALGLLVLTWRVARRQRPDVPLTAAMCAILLSVLLGFVYPSLGINRLPDDLPDDLDTTAVVTFGRPQPGMLSMRLGRSVPQMAGDDAGLGPRLAAFDGYVFALDADAARIEAAATAHGVAIERVTGFRSFYSRKAWLKFFRQGLEREDWLDALAARSADGLKPSFVCFRVGR